MATTIELEIAKELTLAVLPNINIIPPINENNGNKYLADQVVNVYQTILKGVVKGCDET
ncbi:hypothetical protein [Paenibacillus lutrae]|uniref:hypothetical protein n=1 Tax=Paenibacillus lutrae TaxID=2078573 RepID=UPI0012F89EEE|nr:hypothetical protein [Paenibacillus lutrae]